MSNVKHPLPRWNLDDLYLDFDDAWQRDWGVFDAAVAAFEAATAAAPAVPDAEWTAACLRLILDSHSMYDRLASYCSLRMSADVRDTRAADESERLKKRANALTAPLTRFRRCLAATLPNQGTVAAEAKDPILRWCAADPFLAEHRFALLEMREQASHLMSEAEERLAARMAMTGSSAWNRLQSHLTSTLVVSVPLAEGVREMPLSAARNLANEADPAVRKAAFEAELAAYPAIADSLAAALNAIKGEVLALADARGYASPLEETLIKSRMGRGTLDALLTAMKESLPDFAAYLRRKAACLGHEGGLPFRDLFAPMGAGGEPVGWEDATATILTQFERFSPEMAAFAGEVFDRRWIDAEPRDGKRGGAFCAGLHPIGQCRILTNFSGSFSDVLTVAHELGHGYHGHVLKPNSWLNADYPMPLAETASIFSEHLVRRAALQATQDREVRLSLIEQGIQDAAQVIVDIYSRYLFETELFARRADALLPAEALCGMMAEAQKQAYGDGLDQNSLHPYMWACKPHYYSAGYNFYNFPYAFGLLFSLGLLAQGEKEGPAFRDRFRRLLAATGDHSVEEVAAMAGIDVTDPDYWRSALDLVREEIAMFMELTAQE